MKLNLEEEQKKLENKKAEDILKWAFNKFKDKIVFASSFGAEDVVLVNMISNLNPNAKIITLDTGRLSEETYELMEKIRKKYPVDIITYFPDKEEMEKLVNEKGFFSFMQDIKNRKECCRIRKINPLKRALHGMDAWITGLRSSQSVTRQQVQNIEQDSQFNLIKINPLLNWSEKEIWDYIRRNNVPYNKLHDKNYPSVGCEPCTRAIEKGEDVRAGRWWWENPENKECGLHDYCEKGGNYGLSR